VVIVFGSRIALI